MSSIFKRGYNAASFLEYEVKQTLLLSSLIFDFALYFKFISDLLKNGISLKRQDMEVLEH
jgi:hypothetical protein